MTEVTRDTPGTVSTVFWAPHPTPAKSRETHALRPVGLRYRDHTVVAFVSRFCTESLSYSEELVGSRVAGDGDMNSDHSNPL